MRRSIRYVLSAVVGLGALALAVVARDGSVGVLVAIPFVYGVTAALVLDNLATMRAMRGGDARTLGMLGGGVSAGGTIGLLQESIAAGVLGYGLFVFGMAVVIADPVMAALPDDQ
ncbi:uncharacterized protein HHUB_4068 (plasmid) [Halobacterium hubeiense]|uniref:DUF8153 domain-containing protein n=1 Tax=Halobacterium hubeiense TaxID=1407499 RepID=A0A0U5AJD5_9EURY|nr:hypothetical protein [Halobacterium hubeiense]CQH63405.1 uncharacterized protein HHUB_4068 [Halobacterium hubeiense]